MGKQVAKSVEALKLYVCVEFGEVASLVCQRRTKV